MEEKKLFLALTLLLSTLSVLPLLTQSTAEDLREVDDWFNALPNAELKKTKLHYYFHDTLSGDHPSSLRIAESPYTKNFWTAFGSLNMFDNPLTAGPDPKSELIGRAQGFYGSSGQEKLSLVLNINIVFTGKQFNGSSLNIVGRNPILESYRELAIVGGTGVFRLARGIVSVQTYSFNMTSGDAIVDHHATVLHY